MTTRTERVVAEFVTEGVQAYVSDSKKVEQANERVNTSLDKTAKDGAKKYTEEVRRLADSLKTGGIPLAEKYAAAMQSVERVEHLTESQQRRVTAAVQDALQKYKALGQEAPPHIRSLNDQLTRLAKTQKDVANAASAPASTSQLLKFGPATASASNGLLDAARSAGLLRLGLIGGGAAGVAGALVTVTKESFATASGLTKMNDTTGLSISFLQRLQVVADQSDFSLQQFTDTAFTLGARLAGGEGSVMRSVERLGLSYEKLREQSPEEQLQAVIPALMAIDDLQERNRLSMELFGRGAKDVLPALIRNWKDLEQGVVTSTDAQIAVFDRYEARFQRLSRNFKTTLMNMVADALEAAEKAEKGVTTFVETSAEGVQSAAAGNLKGFLLNRFMGLQAQPPRVDVTPPKPRVMPTYSDLLTKADAKAAALSVAQLKEIEAAKKLGVAEAELIQKYHLDTESMQAVERRLQSLSAARGEATEATKRQRQALDELTGVAALREAEALAKQLEAIGGLMNVPASQQSAIVKRIDDLAERSGRLNQFPKVLRDIAGGMRAIDFGITDDSRWQNFNAWLEQLRQTPVLPFAVDFGITDEIRWKNFSAWMEDLRANPDLAFRVDFGITDEQRWKNFQTWYDGLTNPTAKSNPITATLNAAAADFPKRLSQAVLHGQGLRQAFRSIAVDVGADFGDQFGRSLVKGTSKYKDLLGNLFSGAMSLAMLGIEKLIKQGTNETIKVRQDFAQRQGFENLNALLDKLVTSGAEGKALANTAASLIGRHDTAKNEKWMEDVLAFLGKQADLVRESNPTWEDAIELAERYGIEMGALGKASNQAQLTKSAGDHIVAFKKLMAIGANFHGVLAGMSDEIQEVIKQALRFGLDVPEEMRPMLEGLIEMGLLVDENGQRLEDLSRIRFSKSLPEAVQELVNKLDKLIDTILRIPDPAEVYRRTFPGQGPGVRIPLAGRDLPPVPDIDIPSLDTGTRGAYLSADTLAQVHRGEAIVKPGGASELARDVAAALGATKGGGAHTTIFIGDREIKDFIVESHTRSMEQNDSGGRPVSHRTRLAKALRKVPQ